MNVGSSESLDPMGLEPEVGVLGAERIRSLLADQTLLIDPLDSTGLGVASYTLRLSNMFRRWNVFSLVDLGDPDWNDGGSLGGVEELESLTIEPGEFFLGASVEALHLPDNVLGQLSTPSHMARFGLSFIQSSSLVHPGFGQPPSRITFEISCVNPAPVRIPAGLPVCHMVFWEVAEADNLPSVGQRSVYERIPAPAPPTLPARWFRREAPTLHESLGTGRPDGAGPSGVSQSVV